MKSESSKSFQQGFLLDEQELRRIFDLLCQQMKNITKDDGFETNFEIKFENGVIGQPTSLDEIISQENLGSSAIRRIKMSLWGKGSSANYKISLQFLDPKEESGEDNRAIRYKIEGDDRDWVFITSSQLDERISRIKTFTVSPSFFRNLPLLFLYIVAIVLFLPTFSTNKPATERLSIIEEKWSNQEIKDLGQLIIEIERSKIQRDSPNLGINLRKWNLFFIAIFIVAMGLTIFGERMLRFMVPPYNFLWGDYVKVYESRKTKRNFIIVVVMLSLILSVAANYLYDLLKGT